jgi:hypothetical protein
MYFVTLKSDLQHCSSLQTLTKGRIKEHEGQRKKRNNYVLLLLEVTALYQLRMFVSEDWIWMLKEAVIVNPLYGAYRISACFYTSLYSLC